MNLPRAGALFAVCTVIALGLLAQPGAFAQGGLSLDPDAGPSGPPANPPGASVPEGNGADCTFIDFEGVGDNQPVGTVAGTPQVTFGAS